MAGKQQLHYRNIYGYKGSIRISFLYSPNRGRIIYVSLRKLCSEYILEIQGEENTLTECFYAKEITSAEIN